MKKINKKWFSILLIVLLFVLCYLFPYVHDDWAWGSSIGMDRLDVWFADKDGRYVANLLTMLLTRSRILRAIVMTLCFTGIVQLIRGIVHKDNTMVSYLSVFLLLLMPAINIAEGISWTSGFCVYVPPIVLSLLYIFMNKDAYDGKKLKSDLYTVLSMLVLGFFSCLFVEHMTVFCVVLGVAVFVYYFIRNKKINASSLSYMIGTILGTIVMFSNSGYRMIVEGTSQYSYEKNMIRGALHQYFHGFYEFFIHNNFFLNIVLSILLVLLVLKWKKKKHKRDYKIVTNCCMFIIVSYITYLLFSRFISNLSVYYQGANIILGVGSGLFFISSFLLSLICIEDKKTRFHMIVCYCMLLVIGGPLLVISPMGSRQFVPTYVVFVLISSLLFNYLKINSVSLKTIMKIGIVTLFGVYILIFSHIYKIDRERVKYAKSFEVTEENSILYLPSFPCEELMHESSPRQAEFQRRFKLYYHVDRDADIRIVSYQEWKDLIGYNK